jgi:CRISPR-associated protein Csy1
VIPELFAPRPRRASAGRIRVGFLSYFFVDGSVGRYFAPWITGLDRSRFEVFVYHGNERTDALTQSLASAASALRPLAGRPLLARARQVLADALDVLVYPESGMHNLTYLMGALRLAPVQCCAWGHPDTTGHRNMDWFVSCEPMEPTDAPGHYRERLALLPGLGTRYAAARVIAGTGRAALGLPEGRTLYLVPQSLFKIHPDNDELLARVLERDPASVAVMFASPQEAVTRAFAARLGRALARRGLAIVERVLFLQRLSHDDYLRVNAACDVMLDTLHWSGGNTSLDAIACGLPVVTCPGALMRGRQSAAMLANLGVPELVAADGAGYVAIAERLGRDAEWRRALSARMRAGHGALFARDEPVRAFADFLERVAREPG